MKYAAYCMTKNIYHKVIPSLNSLLLNSSVDRVWLVIENNFVGFDLPNRVKIANAGWKNYFTKDGPNYNCQWTYMCMMKVALCKIFKDADRILTLDLDTIVDQNIDELWDLNLDDYYFAGVTEPLKSDKMDYVNAGVIMWNLEKMRDGMADNMIHHLNSFQYNYPEQECMSKLCQGHILQIDSCYNASKFTEPTDEQKIRHFAAVYRWYEDQPLVQKYKNDGKVIITK